MNIPRPEPEEASFSPTPRANRRRRATLAATGAAAVALLAFAVAAILLFVSLDVRQIYAPGAGHVHRYLFEHYETLRGFGTPIGFVTIDGILRKIYALGAFALVGLCFAPLFAPRERLAGSALAVTQFSTVIEILQTTLDHSIESLGSNVFDILSGTAGGLAGAALYIVVGRIVRAVRRSSASRDLGNSD